MRLDGMTRWRAGIYSPGIAGRLKRLFAPGRVLDVGCGSGKKVPEPFIPFGVEISEALSREADTHMRTRGGRAIHAPAVDGVKVAGKTGTAQWGPKKRERTAAWFAGFAPADNPQYAYAALYEGAPGEYAHGGTRAAPMIGDLLRVLFKDQVKNSEKKKDESSEEQDEEDRQMDQSN